MLGEYIEKILCLFFLFKRTCFVFYFNPFARDSTKEMEESCVNDSIGSYFICLYFGCWAQQLYIKFYSAFMMN